jgi:hypothetical protein
MLLGGLNMRDNLEGLRDVLNIELKSIKVSEELKHKTLERCKVNKKFSREKTFLPIACTIAACLFMGIIIYPIYNKGNSIDNEKVAINTSNKDFKGLDEQAMDTPTVNNKVSSTKDNSNKIISSQIIDEQKTVNGSSKVQKQEEIIVLNENPIMPFKIQNSTEGEGRNNGISVDNNNSIADTNVGLTDNEKNTKDDSKNTSLVLSEKKETDLELREEVNMKTLSLQEAREIFQNNIEIPSYIPRNFIMEKILVPEVESSSYKLYEITYKNSLQSFKIIEYKNINYTSGLAQSSDIEAKVPEKYNMVININKIPVNYAFSESTNNKELSYTKFTWMYMGRSYSLEGNAPWAELINIVSSTIR